MKMILDKNKWNHIILFCALAVISVTLYMGNVFTFNTSEIVNLICIVVFPFLTPANALALVAYLIPVHSGITVLYIYGYAILILILKSGKIKVRVVISVLAVIVYEIIMAMFLPSFDFQNIIIYSCTVFLLLYMINVEEANYKLCCETYIIGTMILLISVLTTAIQNSSFEMVMAGEIRIGTYEGVEHLGGQVAVITENANSMAYYALVAVILAFSLLKIENIIGKILLSIAMAFGIFVGMFTISRTFILVLLLGIFLVFVSRFDFKQKALVALAFVLILYIVVPYVIDHTGIFDAFERRFNDPAASDASGRLGLFVEYMEFLFENPIRLIFGTGAIGYKEICNCSNSVHSGLQQILVSYGVVGFFPSLYVLLNPIFNYLKKDKFVLSKVVPLICVVLFTQTIQFLNPFNLMLPYAVAVMYMKIPEKHREYEKKDYSGSSRI